LSYLILININQSCSTYIYTHTYIKETLQEWRR